MTETKTEQKWVIHSKDDVYFAKAYDTVTSKENWTKEEAEEVVKRLNTASKGSYKKAKFNVKW